MRGIFGRSLTAWQFWVLNGVTVVVLMLVLVNIWLFLGNRTIQAQANARQQFINESIRLSRLNSQLIQSLANVSAETDDEQIRGLLAAHGIQFTGSAARAASPSSSPPRSKATPKAKDTP